VDLNNCVYNASGPRTGSREALKIIAGSASGAVLSKSATLVSQKGNDMPRFVKDIDLGAGKTNGSCNSEGLPNQGIDYYLSPQLLEEMKDSGKPYMVSISGLSLADNLEMLEMIMAVKEVEAVELNLACPNVPGKPVIAYDFDQMDSVLKAVCGHKAFGRKPVGVKLAPYFDMPHFDTATSILAKYPIHFVVCVNTIGNALFVDAESETVLIAPKGGYGGLGGGYVKHTALANVKKVCEGLVAKGREDIDVVGVGGVSTGTDAFEMILCGAKAVQVGTCHWTEGAPCFERITRELKSIMQKKGYSHIEDFRGRLKPYQKGVTKRGRPSCGGGKDGTSQWNMTTEVILVAIIVAMLIERYFFLHIE